MKRIILFSLLLSLLGLPVRAQVMIINDNILQGRLSEITATVLDSLTNEPLAFASVYLIPSRDTVITNFTLSDAKGEAKLDEVPYGSYVFRVEMMGYKPFVRERYFREAEVQLGTIRLRPDSQFLEAATVTDVGNPIIVKKDTVEFNAASFSVGTNAMLRDLLQRMPGMEITEDGKVKFNGEMIDKLTVGGRTFFFDDQSAALNNLPASIVDKIRVIDRDSEGARATGLADGARERVLDVALKKEYEKGWFGNIGLKGGSTTASGEDNPALHDERGLLYSGNVLVSAYTEKDQVTMIANGQNISSDSNVIFVRVDEAGEYSSSLDQGLSSAAQLGVNANTSRIRDVETTVSANYKYADTDSGIRSARTTWQEDGNLLAVTENSGKKFSDSFNAGLEFQKEKGNVWFHLRPYFRTNDSDASAAGSSETFRAGNFVNRSESLTRSRERSADGGGNADITFRDMAGRSGRTLRVGVGAGYKTSSGASDEQSRLEFADGVDLRSLHYDTEGNSSSLSGSVRYSEPIGAHWTLSSAADYSWSRIGSVREASDAAGRNDYYSSESRNTYAKQQYDLTAQYGFGERNWVTFGGAVMGVLNENVSRNYGTETRSGEGEWDWAVAPTVRLRLFKGKNSFDFDLLGRNQRPGAARMRPVLDISDPARLSLGNVYLAPSMLTYFSAVWNRNNPERFSNLMAYLSANFTSRPVEFARWYDASGVLYSMPVNSRRPGVSGNFYLNWMTPLDAKKNWSLTLYNSYSFGSSVSYQTRTTLPGLDKDSFDYAEFMDDFWGDAGGDRFYGGQSGFAESLTRYLRPSASINLRYNQPAWSFSVNASAAGNIARYSLDSSVDMNTLDVHVGARGSYTTKHEFEFNSDISYAFYRGYAAGYGRPEWQWNAEISKNLGAFNLSLKLHDILDQTSSLTHTVTANYEEDSYRLVMGRYILFGLKWNFGKMNAAHSRRAQSAAMDMVW